MARKKCYWCEDRFPEDFTTLHKSTVGGNWQRAGSPRPVRACYRCIASRAWSASLNYGVPPGLTEEGLAELRDEKLRRHRWAVEELPPLGEAPYHSSYEYFRILWPYDAMWPAFPAAFPERLLPPDMFRPEEGS